MAHDWIKMRTDLYRDPKVISMAEMLIENDSPIARYVNQNLQRDMSVTRNVMRNAVVGALVSVWGVMRHQGKRVGDDLVSDGTPLWTLDDIADLHGFGDAMASVEWVIDTPESLVFPRFFAQHNSDPAEKHAEQNRERQKRFREAKRNGHSNASSNVTDNVTVTHRAEQSRENKKNGVLLFSSLNEHGKIPEVLRTDRFAVSWDAWVKHRSEINHPLKQTMAEAQLKMLASKGVAAAVAMIDHTIAMGWQGLREPDKKPVQKQLIATDGEPVASLEQFRAAYGCPTEDSR
jgi:hypothetical protein